MYIKIFIRNCFIYLPVCVLICRLSNEGLSKAFPQTSHGNNARSDFAGLLWILGVISKSSLDEPTDEDVNESPDTDLCSSSFPDGGEIGRRTRDRSDVERSSGESITNNVKLQNEFYLLT